MSGGASGCASKRVLLSQFLDTDHRTRRLANDRIPMGAQPPNQAVLRAAADDHQIGAQPLGRAANNMGHLSAMDVDRGFDSARMQEVSYGFFSFRLQIESQFGIKIGCRPGLIPRDSVHQVERSEEHTSE